jgi:hypothetical protein
LATAPEMPRFVAPSGASSVRKRMGRGSSMNCEAGVADQQRQEAIRNLVNSQLTPFV